VGWFGTRLSSGIRIVVRIHKDEIEKEILFLSMKIFGNFLFLNFVRLVYINHRKQYQHIVIISLKTIFIKYFIVIVLSYISGGLNLVEYLKVRADKI